MRVLLLSDIHGNLEALEACLAAAPTYDYVANLGDVVGYGACPNEVTKRSRELGGLIVRGNHDRACTGISSLENFNPVAALAAQWTQRTLETQNLEWLRALPAGPAQLPANGDTAAVCVHGSPMDEDEYVVSLLDAMEVLMRSSAPLTFFGHTHVQGGFAINAEQGGVAVKPPFKTKGELERYELPISAGTRYLINPGSVGQPRDGDWRAAFAIFDSAKPSVSYFRVPYDVLAAQERINAAGLPPRLATRLQEGR